MICLKKKPPPKFIKKKPQQQQQEARGEGAWRMLTGETERDGWGEGRCPRQHRGSGGWGRKELRPESVILIRAVSGVLLLGTVEFSRLQTRPPHYVSVRQTQDLTGRWSRKITHSYSVTKVAVNKRTYALTSLSLSLFWFCRVNVVQPLSSVLFVDIFFIRFFFSL